MTGEADQGRGLRETFRHIAEFVTGPQPQSREAVPSNYVKLETGFWAASKQTITHREGPEGSIDLVLQIDQGMFSEELRRTDHGLTMRGVMRREKVRRHFLDCALSDVQRGDKVVLEDKNGDTRTSGSIKKIDTWSQ